MKKNLYFPNDAYYNGEHIFKAGQTYEVDCALGWADRWIKRGAQEVEKVIEAVEEAPVILPLDPVLEVPEVVEESKPKKKKK